jgi:hypothetical protein
LFGTRFFGNGFAIVIASHGDPAGYITADVFLEHPAPGGASGYWNRASLLVTEGEADTTWRVHYSGLSNTAGRQTQEGMVRAAKCPDGCGPGEVARFMGCR